MDTRMLLGRRFAVRERILRERIARLESCVKGLRNVPIRSPGFIREAVHRMMDEIIERNMGEKK